MLLHIGRFYCFPFSANPVLCVPSISPFATGLRKWRGRRETPKQAAHFPLSAPRNLHVGFGGERGNQNESPERFGFISQTGEELGGDCLCHPLPVALSLQLNSSCTDLSQKSHVPQPDLPGPCFSRSFPGDFRSVGSCRNAVQESQIPGRILLHNGLHLERFAPNAVAESNFQCEARCDF